MAGSEVYVQVHLVCAHGQIAGGEACPNRPTHVLFFERGDASTYCDDHGPNLNGRARLVVVGRAALGGVARVA